jgi:phospholipase C
MARRRLTRIAADSLTRRSFLQRAGATGATLFGAPLLSAISAARAGAATTPIRNVIISCQENRSFDHYFGYAPQVQAAGFGPPAGYTQPDADGNPHAPFEFTSLTTDDPPHYWSAVHDQWNGGAMDGFFKSSADNLGDGNAAIGYYTATELPFYYSLLDNSALVATTSVRCSGRPGRIASTSRRARRAA